MEKLIEIKDEFEQVLAQDLNAQLEPIIRLLNALHNLQQGNDLEAAKLGIHQLYSKIQEQLEQFKIESLDFYNANLAYNKTQWVDQRKFIFPTYLKSIPPLERFTKKDEDSIFLKHAKDWKKKMLKIVSKPTYERTPIEHFFCFLYDYKKHYHQQFNPQILFEVHFLTAGIFESSLVNKQLLTGITAIIKDTLKIVQFYELETQALYLKESEKFEKNNLVRFENQLAAVSSRILRLRKDQLYKRKQLADFMFSSFDKKMGKINTIEYPNWYLNSTLRKTVSYTQRWLTDFIAEDNLNQLRKAKDHLTTYALVNEEKYLIIQEIKTFNAYFESRQLSSYWSKLDAYLIALTHCDANEYERALCIINEIQEKAIELRFNGYELLMLGHWKRLRTRLNDLNPLICSQQKLFARKVFGMKFGRVSWEEIFNLSLKEFRSEIAFFEKEFREYHFYIENSLQRIALFLNNQLLTKHQWKTQLKTIRIELRKQENDLRQIVSQQRANLNRFTLLSNMATNRLSTLDIYFSQPQRITTLDKGMRVPQLVLTNVKNNGRKTIALTRKWFTKRKIENSKPAAWEHLNSKEFIRCFSEENNAPFVKTTAFISLEQKVEENQFVVLIGKPNAGKSTFLNQIGKENLDAVNIVLTPGIKGEDDFKNLVEEHVSNTPSFILIDQFEFVSKIESAEEIYGIIDYLKEQSTTSNVILSVTQEAWNFLDQRFALRAEFQYELNISYPSVSDTLMILNSRLYANGFLSGRYSIDKDLNLPIGDILELVKNNSYQLGNELKILRNHPVANRTTEKLVDLLAIYGALSFTELLSKLTLSVDELRVQLREALNKDIVTYSQDLYSLK